MVPRDNMVGGMSESRIHPGAMGAAAATAAATLPASGGPARTPKFSLSLTLIAFAIFLLSLLWGTVIVHLREERESEIRNAMKNTSNLARVFEEHTVRSIGETDQLLRSIEFQYDTQGTKLDLPRLVAEGSADRKIYNQLAIIGENGDLLMSARGFQPLNLSNSENFKAHIERDTGRVFISKPRQTRTTSLEWSLFLSRRINKPDGSFGGAVSAGVNPTYFSRFYADLDLGKRGVITIVGRDDAIVRVRRSGEDVTVGQDLRKAQLFTLLRASESGSYLTDRSVSDGVARIYSYRALPNYPLVVVVGVATDEALASFNELSQHDLLAAALASLLILGFTAYLLMLVSRRQRTETTLHQRNIELAGAAETNARLAMIVESSNDAIVSCAPDGAILSWNTAAERLFGYTAAEAIGQSISMIIPPEREEEVVRNRALLAQGRAVIDYETVRLAKGGRRIDVSLSQSPTRGASGAMVGSSLIFRDVAERKRAEHKLRESESRFRSLTNLSSDWYWEQDEEYRFVGFSGGDEEKKWGGDQLSTLGLRRWELPGVIPASGSWNEHKALLEARKPFRNFEYQRILEGGSPRYVAVGGEPVFDAGGRFAGYRGVATDITERKREEQELQQFRMAMDVSPDSIYLTDPASMRFVYLNNTACQRLGYTRQQLLQMGPQDVLLIGREEISREYDDVIAAGDGGLRHERPFVRSDGREGCTELHRCALRTGGGTLIVTIGRDITERKDAEERIDHLAQYDAVTGLPNRRLFNDRLTLALARDKRLGAMTAVLLLDLDRFKQINESLGHSVGDKVLQAVTARLTERLREVDTVARLGDDEFAVILESVTDNGQAFCVAEKLVEMMAEPIMLEGEEVFVTASVGVAVCPADADSVEKLIEHAELAMYQAKDEGRNTVQAYVPVQVLRHTGRGIESKLRRAIERDELLLHYQPKVDIKTGAIVGAEALARWRNPELGLVSPADFIPLAEETGLIGPIGEWVLHSACTQAAAWHRQAYPIGIAVNLSARQFRVKNLCEMVRETLADCALDAGSLELEITESMIMHRPERTIATLQQLHDIGVKLSVDDFGTGYSSLSYLKRFPVNNLKIDQSFVRDLHNNADDAAIVRTVIALAKSMNLKTIAEGVETEQQLIYLAGLQCDEYQGYYFSKPVPAAEFLRLLQGAVNLKALSAPSGVAATAGRDPDQAVPA